MMSKTLRIQLKVLILSFLFIVSACKFPREQIEEFELNIDGRIINPLVQIKINTADSALAEKLIFSVSGDDTKWFFDIEGKTNFNAEGGTLYLILHPDAAPTPQNPYKIVLNANKEGYIPVRQELVVSSSSNKLTINLTLRKLSSGSNGISSKVEQLNFLGKKRTDTVQFNLSRPDGVSFNFKMPTKGLVFLRSSNFKFTNGVNKYLLKGVLEDNSQYLANLPAEKHQHILSILKQNNSDAIDKTALANELLFASKTYTLNTLVGYRNPTLEPIEEPRNSFDTLSLTNVRVQMVSESNFREFDFVDENGDYKENIHIFGGDVIGIPELTFYDAKSGTPITPYYPDGYGGVITEVIVNNNNYKLFVEGIGYSTVTESAFQIKKTSNLSSNFFESQPGGGFSFKFKNNLLRSKLFLYKTSTVSCDFKTLTVKAPNIPLNSGFNGSIEVIQPDNKMTIELPFNSPETQFLVTSVPNQNTQIIGKINHAYQACQGNALLYDETIENLKVCEDINLQKDIIIPFNGLNYLNGIPKLANITATARVICPAGNFVVPPTIDLIFWKQGCSQRNQIRVEDGIFTANNFIEGNSNYIIRYDRISSAGKPTTVYDTMFFDPNIANQVIEDNVRGYWSGTLTYTAEQGYKLDLVLDNRKLKYPIPNCK